MFIFQRLSSKLKQRFPLKLNQDPKSSLIKITYIFFFIAAIPQTRVPEETHLNTSFMKFFIFRPYSLSYKIIIAQRIHLLIFQILVLRQQKWRLIEKKNMDSCYSRIAEEPLRLFNCIFLEESGFCEKVS